jgi:MSHA biogenesis protein MshJ
MMNIEGLLGPLRQLAAKVDALTLKERLLLLGATVMLLSYGWNERVFTPLEVKRKALVQESAAVSTELQALDTATVKWAAEAAVDPDADNRRRLAALREELQKAQGTVEAKAGRMVAPERMPEVLKGVLSRFSELEFKSLEGLPVEPVLAASIKAPGKASEAPKPADATLAHSAYKHGIRIRFSGSYRAVTAYLEALEALPYGFFWDRVSLDATQFPKITGSLVVYTVSLRQEWIGV